MALYLDNIEDCLLEIKNGNFKFEYPKEIEEALFNRLEKLRSDDDDYIVRCARFLFNNQQYESAYKIANEYAKKHNINAIHLMGICYYYGRGIPKSYKKALEYFEIGAKKGDARSQNRLASMYFEGRGVIKDYGQAFYWYQKAAEQNYPIAICRLALFYYRGLGVEKSDVTSFNLFKKLLDRFGKENLVNNQSIDFNSGIMFILGSLYLSGDGGEQSYEEAIFWLKEAALLKNVGACYQLALCYYYGNYVNQSYEEAVKWLERPGAKLGPNGSYMLAYCYENGLGVEKIDLETAKKFYGKAYKRGKTEAIDDLRRVRDLIEESRRNSTEIKEEIDIFISWNNKNADIKNTLRNVLEGHDIRIWDSDTSARGDLTNTIEYAIDHAKGYIILLSEEAFESSWMPQEVKRIFKIIENSNNQINKSMVKIYAIGGAKKINQRINTLRKDHPYRKLIDLAEDFSLSNKKEDIDACLNNAIAFSNKVVREVTVLRYQEQLKNKYNVFSPFLSDIPIEGKNNRVTPNIEFEEGYIGRDLTDEQDKTYSPLDILKMKETILIHGEGGSGKSLYIKKLLKDYSKGNKLFFYLECRDIKKEIEQNNDYDPISLINKLAFNNAEYHGINKKTISYIFNNDERDFYIIIDALDEAYEHKKDIIAMINQMYDIRQNLHFIFTSRNKSDASLIASITNLKVKPLLIKAINDQDIIKLFDAIYSRNHVDKEVDPEETSAATIFRNHLPFMADDIKKNPLLMSNLICIYFATQKIQSQRSYILETSTEILIDFLEKERGILNKIENIISRRNFRLKDVLQFVAFQFVVNENMTLEKAINNFNDNREKNPDIKDNDGIMTASEIDILCAYLRQRRIIIGNNFSHDIYLSFFASKYMFSNVYKIDNNPIYGDDQLIFNVLKDFKNGNDIEGKEILNGYVKRFFAIKEDLWPNITLDFIGKLDYEVNYLDKNKVNQDMNELFDYSLTTIIEGMSETAYKALEDIVYKETLLYRNLDIKEHLKR